MMYMPRRERSGFSLNGTRFPTRPRLLSVCRYRLTLPCSTPECSAITLGVDSPFAMACITEKIDCRLAQLLAQQHHRFLVQCAEFVEAEVDDVGLVAGRFVKLAQIIWHAAKGSVIVYLLNRRGVRQEFRDFQIVEWLQPDLRGASAE